ncbi:thioredoxin fold domain-containing protein [Fibrella sp. ES10-3-2-2]|nr:hypothetical protein A6C57_21960 [Fibrella sp. ES10-3-2-2]
MTTFKKIVLVLLVISTHDAKAIQKGVNFSEGTWREIIREAKLKNKPIFIDFYTSWCAPCKKMDKEAFADSSIASFFNKNFINYKVNAEKGEGIALAKKYSVTGYPALLFIYPNEKVIYRTGGYDGVDNLLIEAKKAAAGINVFEKNQNRESLLLSKEDLKAYLTELAKIRQPVGELLDRYLGFLTEKELALPENLSILVGTVSTSKSKAFELLLYQLPLLKEPALLAEASVTMPLVIASDFKKIVDNKDEKALSKLISQNKRMRKLIGGSAPKEVALDSIARWLKFFQQVGDKNKYHKLANFYAENYLLAHNIDSLKREDEKTFKKFERYVVASDSLRQTDQFRNLTESMRHRHSSDIADKLNELALSYLDHMSDVRFLKEALRWTEQEIKLYDHPLYIQTNAKLVYRLNDRGKAIKQQKEAVRRAQQLNLPYKDMLLVLAKMEKGSSIRSLN